jgi:hypothetical protein
MFKVLITFLSKMFQPFKDWNVSFLPLIILNKFKDFEVSDENIQLFYFALTIWILIIAVLINLFNIILTLTILHYKNKYNLEDKFINYPWIVRIIKFYDKISYLTIALEVIWIFFLFHFIYFSFLLLHDIKIR